MTQNNIHCTLTDAELSAKADQWIDELIASGGKSFTMQVPARPNKDTDLIFAELNNRFKRAQGLVDALEALKEGAENHTIIFIDKAIQQWKDGKGKDEPKGPIKPAPELGICKECKTRPAVTDYNGHQHYVCKLCDDSLNRAFDNEYQ